MNQIIVQRLSLLSARLFVIIYIQICKQLLNFIDLFFKLHTSDTKINSSANIPEDYSHILPIRIRAAVQGMVFRPSCPEHDRVFNNGNFCLEQGVKYCNAYKLLSTGYEEFFSNKNWFDCVLMYADFYLIHRLDHCYKFI